MNPEKEQRYREFEELVKSKVNVAELYTKLTGEEFTKVKGKLRAKVKWRDDTNPSLTWVEDKNILTDFTVEKENGNGEHYNPVHIMRKVGGALSYRHALQLLCEMTSIEFPNDLRYSKDAQGLTGDIGTAINLIFKESINRRNYLLNNHNKIPGEMKEFLNKRNIPLDKDFFDVANLGICPLYDVVRGIWIENKIPFTKKEEDTICIYPGMQDSALVFPLYDENGSLCGLKFRSHDKKFTQWIPVTNSCFYNLNNFKDRNKNLLSFVVEGEMNLVAYAIASWKFFDNHENKLQEVRNSIKLILPTGSVTNSIGVLKQDLKKVLYFPDYDITDASIENVKTHKIINRCSNITKQIDAFEINTIDWSMISGVHEKFDLEDFLKSVDYDIKELAKLEQISLPRYCINIINKFCEKIHNTDNRRIAQISLVASISNKLSFAVRKVFEELANKEFTLTKEIVEEIEENSLDATFGDYLIQNGGIAKKIKLEDDKFFVVQMTNFYSKISEETTIFNEYTHTKDKNYTIDVIVGSDIRSGVATPADISEASKFNIFLNTVHSFDKLKFLDPDFISKTSVILQLMKNIGKPVQKYIFGSLCRPQEEFNAKKLKTNLFCLFPRVSVINGNIIKNDNFEVQLAGSNTEGSQVNGTKYSFSILSKQEELIAGDVFWNHLRYCHDVNIMNSLIAQAFDSCTNELHGEGIVPDHGFIIYLDGQSNLNKTTATCCAMSLLGSFKTQQDLLSFNSTGLALEHRLIAMGNALVAIDELKGEIIKSSDVVNLINAIYGGNTKGRGTQNMSKTGVNGGIGLNCSVVITSETAMANLPESIESRYLCIKVSKVSAEEKAERWKHVEYLYKHYDLMSGFMPILISWAQKKGNKFYEDILTKRKQEFKKLVFQYANHERTLDMVTRIISGFEMICNFVKENGITNIEEADNCLEAFVLYWKKEIKTQVNRVKENSSSAQNIKYLAEVIDSGMLNMKTFTNGKWHIQQGKIASPLADVTYEDGSRKLLILAPNLLMNSFNSLKEGKSLVNKFINDLLEAGIIDKDINGSAKLYPSPDSNGKITARSTLYKAIDYEKFISIRNEMAMESK